MVFLRSSHWVLCEIILCVFSQVISLGFVLDYLVGFFSGHLIGFCVRLSCGFFLRSSHWVLCEIILCVFSQVISLGFV